MEIYIKLAAVSFILGSIFSIYKYLKRMNLGIITFDELLKSKVPFILYLRSFDDDSRGINLPVSPFNPLNIFIYSFEEIISNNVKNSLLITVGKPNEKIPELGATRLYLQQDNWKQCVSELIHKANYIIIKPSRSDGFNWELETILKEKLINKIVIYNKLSNLHNSELNKYYYHKLKNKIFQLSGIEMLSFQDKKIFSYFNNELNHLYTNSLEVFNTLSLNDIKRISVFKQKMNYNSPLTKIIQKTFKTISFTLMLIFITCFLYMILDNIF